MNVPIKVTRLIFLFCLLALSLSLFSESAIAQQIEAEYVQQTAAQYAAQYREANIWIIPIRGDIMPSLAAFVRREARNAVNQGADYIIFEIDTFGGRVDSALQITSFITSLRNVRTIAWVNNSEHSMGVSWSAGALIAFSCDDIFMASGTSMGAAAPVIAGPDGGTGAGEKTVAAVRSQIAALAERNGHPVGLALAMVDFDVELWEVEVDGKIMALTIGDLERMERDARGGTQVIERIGIISPAGKLLSLTAGEAERFGLLTGRAESREELLSKLGITGEITESAPSASDSIISFLTSGPVQAILILLALVMLFLEFQSPGFGIPGVTALISFLIVFGSSALLGRVGSLEIILFLLGLGLLAVEIFVLPGFGVMGISGILLVGISLLLSMQDFVIPRFEWEWTLLGRNAVVVSIGLVTSILVIALLALMGPKIKLFDRLMLKTTISGTSGGPDPDSPAGKKIEAITDDDENFAELIGKTGITNSVLRPSGKAVFDDKTYDVVADGEFIEAGTNVIVRRVFGSRIVVKKV